MNKPIENSAENQRITAARFTAMPRKFSDPMPEIYVVLEGETEERFLLTYFPDEISFTASELLGKTVAEARQLHYDKDRAYLRS
jgi:hypothetical protein